MSSCTCDAPVEFRATDEDSGEDFLYLRCRDCGGKAGRVDVDMDAFTEQITNPDELDATRPDVAESVVEHGMPTVSIHLNAGDSPFTFNADSNAD